ncbi:LamG-like jellyroll fold domain-containing protein [Pontibacter cellulosilyticus]|uniref:T9SS type A sorting domain-containing protein n=1 Tax=Pontibacter cellulosilyticus TaxID=1720253 RepID=A0A923SPL6_9BACT|nr:LamG-like jellyroll fold domain-containing protein [Pontibacter cellulosilyticus]MBC5994270.1 T9SS type A sorting domain-containing protein [Pontibacter cellulosilyticus]
MIYKYSAFKQGNKYSNASSAYALTNSFAFTLTVTFFILSALFFSSGLAVAQTLGQCPAGLVHYFGFDETASTIAYKDYISATTADCSNCPSPAAGLFAGAQQFDGKDDGLNLSSVSNFEWGPNSDFTIELWMQVTGSAATSRVMIGRNATDSRMIWWIGVDVNGYAVFELRDRQRNGFIMGHDGVKVNDGKWHHIVVVRDGRVRRNKLYVDGYAVGNFEFDYNDNFESISPVNIGYLNLDNQYRYNGKLDELMVYNRALEEPEVRNRYNNGMGNYCGPELVKPSIVSEPITFSVVGQNYIYDVNATGKPAPTYSIVSGPAGLSINATTGEIRWIPSATGTFDVTVKAVNGSGEATQSFKIEVKKDIGEAAGLVHHWMLNETSGLRYKDFYTPYDAATEGDYKPKPVKGAVSGAQHFDGKDDRLIVDEGRNFNWAPGASFSIELWMRTTASTSGNRVLLGRNARESNVHWWVGVDNNGQAGFQMLDFMYEGAYVGNSGPVLNDGKWHQIVAVRDGASGNTLLYVDGQQRASGSFNHRYGFESVSPVTMGYIESGQGYHYEGDLDEVKLFGRVLTPDEIQSRYQKVYDAITELISFTGEYSNGSVYLDWATAAEADMKNYEIERSENGEFFEKIGEVQAAGNSNIRVDYEHIDPNPLPDKSYYRLKINKMNGAFIYSNIVVIQYGGLTSSTFILYPNPATVNEEVAVEIGNMPKDEEVKIVISDARGRTLAQEVIVVQSDGSLKFTIPVSDNFTSGIYNVSVVSDKKIISRKLVIAR